MSDRRSKNSQVQTLQLYLDRVKSKILTYYCSEMRLQNIQVSPEILKNKFLYNMWIVKTLLNSCNHHK